MKDVNDEIFQNAITTEALKLALTPLMGDEAGKLKAIDILYEIAQAYLTAQNEYNKTAEEEKSLITVSPLIFGSLTTDDGQYYRQADQTLSFRQYYDLQEDFKPNVPRL